MKRILLVVAAIVALAPSAPARRLRAAPPNPVVVLETAKGTIEFELFALDAPKSTAHLVDLVRHGFYRGLRFHRITALLAQVGDPLTRNMSMEAYWGNGNSGHPIGVAEISPRHKHVRGAVGLAYSGEAKFADSQFYIMKTAAPSLDGKYAVVGQVTSGLAVVDKIVKGDVIRNASIKGEGRK